MNPDAMTAEALYDAYLLGNYARSPLTLARGAGARAWDTEGREYLDFTCGIAVNTLGHCHPHWVERVQAQAATLVHTSNLYRNENAGRVAARLVAQAGPGRVVFNNSGAEANEFLLKLARLHGQALSGREGQRYTVVTAEQSFHGRLFGGMAATPQEKVQGGFRPMLPGFKHAPLNDLAAWDRALTDEVAAVLVETVQGEGGVFPAEAEFLRGLRALCAERKVLFMIDEVQCGLGRTGAFFAYHHAGVRPDAIGLAKGLGGGFPIGACWIAEEFCGYWKPGMHGSTYAGSPLATAAALAVLEVVEREDLVARVRERSVGWIAALRALAAKYPRHIAAVRGLGYMTGLGMADAPAPYIAAFRAEGLLTVAAGANTVRVFPPLNASPAELEDAVHRLDRALAAMP